MNINNLAKAISTELEQYSQEIANNLKKDTEIIAKECADELKVLSPKSKKGGSKTYAKGWTFKKAYESNAGIRYRVFNKNKPQITHLLEYGHAKMNGGRVEAKPHIKQAETKAKENLTSLLENDIISTSSSFSKISIILLRESFPIFFFISFAFFKSSA